MPLAAEQIANHRANVRNEKAENSKLVYIANLHPKVTIPVIINILEEIIQLLPDEQDQTKQIARDALGMFQQTDEHQNASIFSLPGILKQFKDKIKIDLEAIVAKLQNITVTVPSLDLWKEAALFLNGLHKRVYDKSDKDKNGQPLKDKEGTFKTIDAEDKIFKAFTTLTKMDIANYYRLSAEAIQLKIQACLNRNADGAGEARMNGLLRDLANAPRGKLEVEENENDTVIRVVLPKNNIALRVHLMETLEKLLRNPDLQLLQVEKNPPEEFQGDELVKMLSDIADTDEKIKIQILELGVSIYGLTGSQRAMFAKFRAEIISQLNNYLFSYYFFNRSHAQLAKDKINELGATEDPLTHLNILFSMRTDLISVCSDELLGKVNNLLLQVFTMLHQVKLEPVLKSHMPGTG